jgi:cell division transport system permease protein
MATLFVLGAFLLFLLDVKIAITGVDSQLEINVYLTNNIKITDQQNIYNKIKSASGVTSVTFKSKAQALADWKKELGSKNQNLIAGMESDNPLPDAYVIKVNGPNDVPKIVDHIKGLPGIEQISDGQSYAQKLSIITGTIQWIGVVLFIILIAVSLFLISNTIRLTVYSRRREISIMKYIGATDWFIRWPFIFEGMIIGFMGAVLAVIAVYLLYNFVYDKMTSNSLTMFMTFIQPSFVLTTMSWGFVLVGIVIGAIGSTIVIRKFLLV